MLGFNPLSRSYFSDLLASTVAPAIVTTEVNADVGMDGGVDHMQTQQQQNGADDKVLSLAAADAETKIRNMEVSVDVAVNVRVVFDLCTVVSTRVFCIPQ